MDRRHLQLFAAFTLVLLVIPFTPIAEFTVYILALAIVWAIYAIGFHFLLGYTGLLSFGHSLFFATGAYAVALTLRHTSIASFEVILLIAVVAATLVAMVVGALCVRTTAIYFAMLTLAFTQLGFVILVRARTVTGGSDGVSVATPTLLGFDPGLGNFMFTIEYLYYLSVVFLVVSIYAMYRLVNSPLGMSVQAIRENPERAQFIGIPVTRYRWYAFVVSGVYAGVAGALTAIMRGFITPQLAHFLDAAVIVVTVLIGGVGFFTGPIAGGLAFPFIEVYAHRHFGFWELFIGLVLIAVVIFFSRGIAGELEPRVKRWL